MRGEVKDIWMKNVDSIVKGHMRMVSPVQTESVIVQQDISVDGEFTVLKDRTFTDLVYLNTSEELKGNKMQKDLTASFQSLGISSKVILKMFKNCSYSFSV